MSTLCAIIIGTVGVAGLGGYNRSIQYSLQTSFVRSAGHLQVQNKDYYKYGSSNPALYSIQDYDNIISKIKSNKKISNLLSVVTPALAMTGLANNNNNNLSRPVLIFGEEAADMERLNSWDGYNLDGHSPLRIMLDKKNISSALLGSELYFLLNNKSATKGNSKSQEDLVPKSLTLLSEEASKHNEIGGKSRLELLVPSAYGAPNVANIEVDGIKSQGSREMDESYVGIHLKKAQQLLFGNEKDPGVTAIMVQLKKSADLEKARSEIISIIGKMKTKEQLSVYDFTQLNPLYNQITHMFKNLFLFFLFLIVCLALFSVGNTMSMTVLERMSEIGTLRAIGFKKKDIQWLFMLEGTLMGLIGLVAGDFMSFILSFIVNCSNLTWQPPGVIEPVPLQIILRGEWRMMTIIDCTMLSATILSSWLPAKRASNTNIIESLRHQ
ncbi:ABC transporter permease [Pantoea rodasii]|nr:FtsX-like permease family protein [Pantoea rodasii]